MRRYVFVTFAVILVVGFFVSAGYRASYELHPVVLDRDYEEKILAEESRLQPVPGTDKTFDWRFEDHRMTPYALVQLHGWSATRQEISPVGEMVARELGMNLFMTRFCGHGLGVEEMGKITVECLLHDAEEAIAVGKKMGQKVVLLGTSTGAALAFALACEHAADVAALVVVSPNFRPLPVTSLLLKGPLGALIARWGVRTHSWQPSHMNEEKYWTIGYPAIALHELMNLLSWTNQIEWPEMKIPMQVFFSPEDQVVSPELIQEAFQQYGGPKDLVEMKGAPHVLAGTVFNPSGTPIVVEKMKSFLKMNLNQNSEVATQHQ